MTVAAPRCHSEAVSLTGRWLPQFDLVSLGIDDPAKLAVLRVVDLVEDVAALRLERRDQSVKVFNAVVDHERGFAWSKLLAFLRSNQPGGRSACGLAIRVDPVERGTAPRLDIDAEMSLVPSLQCRCILCLEKDAADASDSLHVNLRCGVVGVSIVCGWRRANLLGLLKLDRLYIAWGFFVKGIGSARRAASLVPYGRKQ